MQDTLGIYQGKKKLVFFGGYTSSQGAILGTPSIQGDCPTGHFKEIKNIEVDQQ